MVLDRVDVAQDLARLVLLLGRQQLAAHQEGHRAARVHHVAADAPVQVFLARDGFQHVGRGGVGHVLGQHAAAGFFQAFVDFLDRVGRVFGVGRVQVHQHVLGVAHRARAHARAQPHQAEHRQVFVVDGEQHVLGQHEGDAHVARHLFLVEQEVGADMDILVLALEITRGRFQVAQVFQFRKGDAIGFLDPVQFLVVGIDDIDPDRLVLQQLIALVDLLLGKPAFLQDEQVDHPRDSLLLIATKNKDKREDKRRRLAAFPGIASCPVMAPRGMPRGAGPRASVIALSRGCARQADKAMAFAWVGWLAGRGKIRHGGRAWRRRRWHGKTLARSSDCGQGRRSAEPDAPGGSSLRSPQ
ncbi:hypothetical protein CBM2589_B230029 [Cupriavidus taiwanensis]|uniref:Uncharacterized protein n=1 Tax=Cupriavidus taiwanensis TaxID=164546 RepID=A0A375BQI3_9BURK|nr:hypothetical protein CBM2589_B230029 [Cupriavidus taiwanensis]